MNTGYRPRLIDERLKQLLGAFGGVLIEGPKWCGKSWTASQQAASEIYIDQQDNKTRALLLPESVLEGRTPRLIDEWQDAPVLWDTARRVIDSRHIPGQFIFTGSSTLRTEKPSHTGTGRFARLRMRPLSLYESGDSAGTASLQDLFADGILENQISEMNAKKAIRLICKGGWPASFWVSEDAAMLIAGEYLNSVAEEDIERVGGSAKKPALVKRILRSLSRNSATSVKLSKVAADVSSDGGNISDQTVRTYYEAMQAIFVIEKQEAWSPSLRSRVRIRTTPKRHLADPSLAAAALGATPQMLEEDIKTAGFLFETLCFRDLSVYADSLGGKVYHYQDETGLEADAIVQLPDNRWAAVEVKLGTFEFDKAAENLIKLKRKIAEGYPTPAFLAILTASGGVAYTRSDGVLVIPIDCLKA
jgi:predicted AAA+ superfamily ATPase